MCRYVLFVVCDVVLQISSINCVRPDFGKPSQVCRLRVAGNMQPDCGLIEYVLRVAGRGLWIGDCGLMSGDIVDSQLRVAGCGLRIMNW